VKFLIIQFSSSFLRANVFLSILTQNLSVCVLTVGDHMMFNGAVYVTVELDINHEWDRITMNEVKAKAKLSL
jgi:hypothetical protein